MPDDRLRHRPPRLRQRRPVLFRRLLIPGVIDAILGAYILTSISGDAITPYIVGYVIRA